MHVAFMEKFRPVLLIGMATAAWVLIGAAGAVGQDLDMGANPDAPSPPVIHTSPNNAGDSEGGLIPRKIPDQPPRAASDAAFQDQNPVGPATGRVSQDQSPTGSAGIGTPRDQTSGAQAPAGQTSTDRVDSNRGAVTASPPGASMEATKAVGAAGTQAVVQTVAVDRPTVLTTAELRSGDTMIPLEGIEGLSGEPAKELQSYLDGTDQHLNCQKVLSATAFVCVLRDGTDLAEVALINGAATTRPGAPEAYRVQEARAQDARRGMWVNLPPPPETVAHPMVPNTATLAGNGKAYELDGIQGLGQPYNGQLQGYIGGAGDSLNCSLQPASGRYICLLPDGTDLAKVALVNGAAIVAPDAPDSYRQQQQDAMNNRRGYWFNPPPDARSAFYLAAPPPDNYEYALIAGDDGADGITYVGGAPTAVIDGEEVFLTLGAGALGWGYYDHWHHWREAPDRFRAHMERFHPEGHGLRGYGHEAAFRPGGERAGMGGRFGMAERPHFEPGRPGFSERPGFAGSRPGFAEHPTVGGERPGFAGSRPGFAEHPAVGGEHAGFAEHPGALGRPAVAGAAYGHPGIGPAAVEHPNMAVAAAGRPGVGAPVGARPGFGAPAAAGGFAHPGPMPAQGGIHPAGGMPAAVHAVAAPAPHVAAAPAAGGGKKH